MRITSFLSFLLCLAFTCFAEPAEARCPAQALEYYLITTAPIHRDGAIVVGARMGRRRATEEAAGFPELSLQRGVRIPLTLERLSPVLAIYRPTRRLQVGSYELVGLVSDGPAPQIQAIGGEPEARVATPVVRAVRAITSPSRRRTRGSPVHLLRVVFGELPRGAIAVHVSAAGQGFAGAPMHRSYDVDVHRQGGRCHGGSIGGSRPVGTEVEVRVIDGDGRLGPPVALVVRRGRVGAAER